jgi:hypothetical protein
MPWPSAAIKVVSRAVTNKQHQGFRVELRNLQFLPSFRPLRWALLLYGILSLSLLQYYQYDIDPDRISYISLAQKYMHGDFCNAINGLWSPFFCWLLVPFLAAHVEPLLASKLLSVVVGFFVLPVIYLLLSLVKVEENIKAVYLLSLCPLIAWFALHDGGPDLLALGIILFYIYLVVHRNYRKSRSIGVACGTLGGLAYLAKSYNFYFFLLHFTFITLWHVKCAGGTSATRKTLFNYLTGIVVFAMICGAWINVISHKYHKFTVSTAGTYNLALNGPSSLGYPMDCAGLIQPSNLTAVSSFEDPTYQPYVTWKPLATTTDRKHLAKVVLKNIFDVSYMMSKNPVYIFTILYFLVLFLTDRGYVSRERWYLVLTVLLYPAGYYMMHIEERYIWVDEILIIVLSGSAAGALLYKSQISSKQRRVVMALLALLMIACPMHRLLGYVNVGKDSYLLSLEIKKHLNLCDTRVAAQAANDQGESWRNFLYVSYYLGDKYYGVVKKDESDEEVQQELQRNHIQYYLVDGKLKNHLDMLKLEMKIGTTAIYRVEPAGGA